jgi:hypothetical protein
MTPRSATGVSSRDEIPASPGCAAPGCANPLPAHGPGRPASFCSQACRARAYRQRQRQRQRQRETIVAEVDLGSTSSKGRTEGRVWLVRLRRGNESVIIAIGLSRMRADALAERITKLL